PPARPGSANGPGRTRRSWAGDTLRSSTGTIAALEVARSAWRAPERGGRQTATMGGLKEAGMADTKTAVANKPVWVDLSSDDAAASREFYAKLFGWKVEVNPEPQYGGYAMANVGDRAVAGIGPKMSPQAPTAWSIYIGTEDAKALAGKVEAAGGTVIAPPFSVGDQGVMATFQDPTGALISAWQPGRMADVFPSGAPNTFAWAELNARGIEKGIPFYAATFGWTAYKSERGEGVLPFTEFLLVRA